MSKQELQKATMDASGVSYDESLQAGNLTPTLYERIGDDGFKQLSQTFYDKVFLEIGRASCRERV